VSAKSLRPPRLAALLAVLAGCQQRAPALSPAGLGVQVAERDAPPGALNLGPAEATHGEGCGLHGRAGTYESAVAALRNEAADRGGDYVHLVKVVEPHLEGGCYDNRFVVRGVVFRVKGGDPALAAAIAKDACTPACSAGYACEHRICRAVCDPPCGPQETCGQDRTCRRPASP
jgi:hypothetical protein